MGGQGPFQTFSEAFRGSGTHMQAPGGTWMPARDLSLCLPSAFFVSHLLKVYVFDMSFSFHLLLLFFEWKRCASHLQGVYY